MSKTREQSSRADRKLRSLMWAAARFECAALSPRKWSIARVYAATASEYCPALNARLPRSLSLSPAAFEPCRSFVLFSMSWAIASKAAWSWTAAGCPGPGRAPRRSSSKVPPHNNRRRRASGSARGTRASARGTLPQVVILLELLELLLVPRGTPPSSGARRPLASASAFAFAFFASFAAYSFFSFSSCLYTSRDSGSTVPAARPLMIESTSSILPRKSLNSSSS